MQFILLAFLINVVLTVSTNQFIYMCDRGCEMECLRFGGDPRCLERCGCTPPPGPLCDQACRLQCLRYGIDPQCLARCGCRSFSADSQ